MMCTIMTFDKDTFAANKDAILATIKLDGQSNPHGWNLILAGDTADDAMFLQCMKLSWVTSALTNEGFSRFWLHSRRSTTSVQGLSGCHGFRSYTGWFIQHNGILRSGRADKLPVDSMVISELLEYMTPQHVSQWLLAKESYANVFMINPEKGEYHVVRCSQGTLYTDGRGNYSSSSIPTICPNAVPIDFHSQHTFPVSTVTHSFGNYGNYGSGMYGTYGGGGSRWSDDEEDWRWAKRGGRGNTSAHKSVTDTGWPNKEAEKTATSVVEAESTKGKGKGKKEVTVYTKYHTLLDSELIGMIAAMPDHDLLMEYQSRNWGRADCVMLNEATENQLAMLITYETDCKTLEEYRENKEIGTKYSGMANSMLEACYVRYGWVDSIPGGFWQNATAEQRKYVGAIFSADHKRREARAKAIADTVPAKTTVN